MSVSGVDCVTDFAVICRKFLPTPNFCDQTSNASRPSNLLDLLLDPKKKLAFKKAVAQKKADFKEIFDRLDLKSSFPSMFSILWYSTLPCHDVRGVTSKVDGERSVLKLCSWKGKRLPCSSIFTKFPTDQGLCCVFNMEAADAIFSGKSYPKLLVSKQSFDNESAFTDSSLPKWFLDNQEPKSQFGVNKGLTVIMDAHSDILSAGSVDSSFQGFTGLISNSRCFPLIYQKGFQIRPGFNNLISLTATKVEAQHSLKNLQPWRRNCLFRDETENLTLHKQYSQPNCFLECYLQNAQDSIQLKANRTCSPWFFPNNRSSPAICDPWQTVDFLTLAYSTPDSQCRHCLPSCSTTIYNPTLTLLPFRRCDDTNVGVSDLCNLNDPTIPDPKIWAQQVIDGHGSNPPEFISGLKSSRRQFLTSVGGSALFSGLDDDYDAFDKDIAVVQVIKLCLFHILSSKNICYIFLIVFINQLQTFESLVFDEKDLSKAGVELTKYWSGSIHMGF